jgi:ubiquinone/menaquinone biosynthesis C-methylase UbiE
MNHKDHVSLIEKAIRKPGGVWAYLGAGSGAFTLALRDIGGEKIEIYSVDKYLPSLEMQKEQFEQQFPYTHIHYLHIDFTEELPLPQLDGILMANSLHFLKNQDRFLRKIRNYLKPEGTLLLVEYNASQGNTWVPYPVSFKKFEELAADTGFTKPTLLHKVPSQFLNEIYSATAQMA